MQHQVENELLDRDNSLAEIVRRLVSVYAPRSVYLFGSKARGDDGPDSDYDILVVVPDGTRRESRKSSLGYKALWGTGTAADVLVCTEDFFNSRADVRTSLPAREMRECKLLYARSPGP